MPAPESVANVVATGSAKPNEQLNSPLMNAGPTPTQMDPEEALDKTTPFKRGGKVGSASKRADGIAKTGKTRGRLI